MTAQKHRQHAAPARRRGLLGLVAALLAALAFLVGSAAPSGALSVVPDTLVANYAEGNWETGTPGLSVRIAPGVETLNGQRTSFLEASITGTACIRGHVVTADLSLDISGRLFGVNVAARQGRADVLRIDRLDGSVTSTPAGKGCANPDASRTRTHSGYGAIAATWRNAPGATPIEYSGEDCGGTGQCYYIDAVASGWITLPGLFVVDLGKTPAAFLYQGVFTDL
jgi:hypothetical protein